MTTRALGRALVVTLAALAGVACSDDDDTCGIPSDRIENPLLDRDGIPTQCHSDTDCDEPACGTARHCNEITLLCEEECNGRVPCPSDARCEDGLCVAEGEGEGE